MNHVTALVPTAGRAIAGLVDRAEALDLFGATYLHGGPVREPVVEVLGRHESDPDPGLARRCFGSLQAALEHVRDLARKEARAEIEAIDSARTTLSERMGLWISRNWPSQRRRHAPALATEAIRGQRRAGFRAVLRDGFEPRVVRLPDGLRFPCILEPGTPVWVLDLSGVPHRPVALRRDEVTRRVVVNVVDHPYFDALLRYDLADTPGRFSFDAVDPCTPRLGCADEFVQVFLSEAHGRGEIARLARALGEAFGASAALPAPSGPGLVAGPAAVAVLPPPACEPPPADDPGPSPTPVPAERTGAPAPPAGSDAGEAPDVPVDPVCPPPDPVPPADAPQAMVAPVGEPSGDVSPGASGVPVAENPDHGDGAGASRAAPPVSIPRDDVPDVAPPVVMVSQGATARDPAPLVVHVPAAVHVGRPRATGDADGLDSAPTGTGFGVTPVGRAPDTNGGCVPVEGDRPGPSAPLGSACHVDVAPDMPCDGHAGVTPAMAHPASGGASPVPDARDALFPDARVPGPEVDWSIVLAGLRGSPGSPRSDASPSVGLGAGDADILTDGVVPRDGHGDSPPAGDVDPFEPLPLETRGGAPVPEAEGADPATVPCEGWFPIAGREVPVTVSPVALGGRPPLLALRTGQVPGPGGRDVLPVPPGHPESHCAARGVCVEVLPPQRAAPTVRLTLSLQAPSMAVVASAVLGEPSSEPDASRETGLGAGEALPSWFRGTAAHHRADAPVDDFDLAAAVAEVAVARMAPGGTALVAAAHEPSVPVPSTPSTALVIGRGMNCEVVEVERPFVTKRGDDLMQTEAFFESPVKLFRPAGVPSRETLAYRVDAWLRSVRDPR